MNITKKMLTTLVLTLLTSVCIAEEPKTVIETPAIPKSLPKTWLTYHLAHLGSGNAVPGDPNPARRRSWWTVRCPKSGMAVRGVAARPSA